jgi:hypothetical protein
MRHEFAPEETMASFHRVEHPQVKLGPPTRTEERLPIRQSVAVIAGLSVLAWVAVGAVVIALRASI